MKIRFNKYSIIAIIFTTYLITCLCNDIGKKQPEYIVDYNLPLTGFLLMSFMFLLGYLSDKEGND